MKAVTSNQPHHSRLPATTIVARALCSLALVLMAVAILTTRSDGPNGGPLFALAGVLAILPATTVGTILVTRLPANRIGWLLLIGGLLFAASGGVSGLADFGLNVHPGSVPGAVWLAWLAGWITVPFVVLALVYLPLLYPTGRLLSPRWRSVALAGAVVMVGFSVAGAFTAFTPGTYPPAIENPLIVRGPIGDLLVSVGNLAPVLLIAVVFVALGSLIVRFRRAVGVERAQLRWFAAVLAIAGPALAIAILTSDGTSGIVAVISNVSWGIAVISFALLPVAIGVAVLRYRLYEIDVLINRTAVHGSVTAILTVVFGAAYVALQRLVEQLTGQPSDLVAAVVVGGAAIAFNPLRRRVRPLVDRVLPARATLTLLFTDIVDSTKAVVELGDERWRGLLERYLATVRGEIARHRGHEVNTAGDAFFATFDQPLAGLACAFGIRTAVRALGLEIRTGLHLGEVELRGEQPSGLAVHTAARVMAAARGGEVLVSESFREAPGVSELALADRGRHELRGVPGEWQLYAAEPQAAGG